MDLPFKQRQVRRIDVMKAAQMGISEAVRNVMGCLAHQEPDPMLLVLPDEKAAKKIMRKRILPLFEDTPSLAALKTEVAKDQALSQVYLRNGFDLGIAWSGSATTLASDPIRTVIFDETDKFADWSGKESDPISLGDVRTATFDNSVQYAISTPTTREGIIYQLHDNAPIKLWFYVPCPHCDYFQRLVFDRLEWGHKDVADHKQRAALIEQNKSAWYRCAGCGEKILDVHKPKMCNRGYWGTEDGGYKLFVNGSEEGIFPSGTEVGMHISALYSLAAKHKFYVMAAEWCKCAGDPMRTQGFRNSWLGEVFEEIKTKPKSGAVREKSMGAANPFTPPPWTSAILASADTQKDHFYFVIRAWGYGYRSQLLHYGQAQTFDELYQICLQSVFNIGSVSIQPRYLMIDSGGTKNESGASRTQEVYQFAMRDQRIVPSKGASHAMMKPWQRTYVNNNATSLFMLDTEYYKDMLARFMCSSIDRQDGTKEEQWMPHNAVSEDYCKQMASEHKIIDRKKHKQVWVPITAGVDNHYWDCEVMQCALAEICNVATLQALNEAPQTSNQVQAVKTNNPSSSNWASGYRNRW